MELLFVRHGQSMANLSDRLQGWGDSPLSPEGEREAALLGQYMKTVPFQALYASPLRRAMQTAGAITAATGVPPLPRPGLKEMRIGSLEGLTIPEVEARWPGLMGRWMSGNPSVRLPGGESLAAFYARITRALEAVLSRHEGSDNRIVIVAHGGAINAMFTYLRDGKVNSWVQGVGNCSVTELVLTGHPGPSTRRVEALRFGDMTHLGKTYEPWAAADAVVGKAG